MEGFCGTYGDRREIHTRFCLRNLTERHNLLDLIVDGRTTLKCILNEYDGRVWTGFVCLTKRRCDGFMTIIRKTSGSIKCSKFELKTDY